MTMRSIELELTRLQAQEQKLLVEPPRTPALERLLGDRVPPALRDTLEKAFAKAFGVVLGKGRRFIAHSFDAEGQRADFTARASALTSRRDRAAARALEGPAATRQLKNGAAALVSGAGMGLLGIGLPDIPLFLGQLLREVSQTAASLGYACDTPGEQVYLLRLIRAALTPGEERQALAPLLSAPANEDEGGLLRRETQATARALSRELLAAKFLQGLPVVGVVGGAANWSVHRRVARTARLYYKKRRLLESVPLPPSS